MTAVGNIPAHMQACAAHRTELFQDRELLKKLCDDPKLFYKTLFECSQGKTQALEEIVASIPEAEDVPEMATPNKKQKEAASKMDPGELTP